MAGRRLSDEQIAQAEHLLSEGMPVTKVAEAVGTTPPTIYRRFIHTRDPKPGGNGRRSAAKTRKPGPSDEQLTGLFTKVAVAPAIPMGLWVQCDFCAAHFVNTGPDAASKLVEMSRDHPALRNLMEVIWRYADEAAWAMLLATWAGIPLAHHAAPEFIYRWLQLPLGLPPRGQPARPTHSHATSNGDAPAPTPFAGMDIESLMRMAEGMGIKFDMPVPIVTEDAEATETDIANTEPAATPAQTETDSVAPVTADSDSGE